MPRICKTELNQEYLALRQTALERGENRDCSVKAVALVCGVDYEVAHATLKSLGRQEGCGVRAHVVLQAVKQLGHDVERKDERSFIDRYPAAHHILKGVTSHHPRRFNNVWKDGNNYLLFTVGHVLAVIDGEALDWSKNKALRAFFIYRITKAS